jgi:hypothetical protein
VIQAVFVNFVLCGFDRNCDSLHLHALFPSTLPTA